MKSIRFLLLTVIIFLFSIISLKNIYAHCDGIDGPVVTAAKKSLVTGNINYVLIWVREIDEAMIKDAFNKTLRVRILSQDARELADTYFFETLVRIHRAGEGEPYTGLKPAGRDLGPVIPAADKAIDSGSFSLLEKIFDGKNINLSELEKNFNETLGKKNYNSNNVEAGRSFVSSYIKFLHLAEHMYDTGHLDETGKE